MYNVMLLMHEFMKKKYQEKDRDTVSERAAYRIRLPWQGNVENRMESILISVPAKATEKTLEYA